MNHIQWSDKFLVGVELIDRHNRRMVELIMQAREVLLENPQHVSGCSLIDELVQYLFYHFATEEIWMRRRRYQKLTRHVEDHLRCTSLIVEKNKNCHAGAITCLQMLEEMFNMLVPHILSYDADYVHARG